MPDDKIQREIEDILNRLDAFVPEEGVASRVRRRSSGTASSFGRTLLAPLAGLSIRHVMLASLALILAGFFAGRAYPTFGHWTLIAGVILFFTAIVLSIFNRGAAPPATEKRWRGQPMHLEGPTLGDRLRAWFNAKRKPRY